MIYLFILLLRLVAYLEGQSKIISFIGVFIIMVYSIIKRTPIVGLNKISKIHFYALLSLIVLIIHSSVFGNFEIRDLAVLLTYWIWFIFTFVYFRNKTLIQALKYVLITFSVFNIANYLFFYFYFYDQQSGVNTLMEIFGFKGWRIYFPLSSGANFFTFQLGANTLLTLHFIKIQKRKILYIFLYVFYMYMLILADSRLVLLLTMFFSFIYLISARTLIFVLRKHWWVIVLIIIISIYIFYTTSIFDGVKRPGERAVGHVASRLDIWGAAYDLIVNDVRMFFGHGLRSFETHILNSKDASINNLRVQTSHNFFLQCILDFGILGVMVIIGALLELVKRVKVIKSQIVTILFVMFLLIGSTEAIPTFYSFDSTFFYIALLSIIIIFSEKKSTESV